MILRSSASEYLMIAAAVSVVAASDALASPTPNGSSFANATDSRVDYTKRTINRPRTSCQSLVQVSQPHNTILSATLLPEEPGAPELCVVRGVLSPEVQFIVYLPSRWNRRFYMHGNGGFAGESLDDEIGHLARLKAARLGFVAAFTNAGHDATSQPGADWGHNGLQKEIDFGFRAVHVTAMAVKDLAAIYYGKAPAYSYFDGCSTGGLQGFSEAQRFPDDFDGILAGAPVFNLTSMMWQYWKNHRALSATPLSREKLTRLGETVLGLFDEADGVADGVIGNPAAIDFDPQRDLPRASAGLAGFTDDEIKMLETVYGPTYVGGTKIYPGTVVGGELPGRTYSAGTFSTVAPKSAWDGRALPDRHGTLEQPLILESWFRFLAFETDDSTLDWQALDPERDLPRMQQSSRIFDATDPDLGAFHRQGGKMIVYHGWADFGISPLRTADYYGEVTAVLGAETPKFLQLYMIPGMHHCTGGVNIDRFDLMTPLINWVERGVAPKGLVGHSVIEGEIARTRPLCAYPRVARYRGTGSIDAHENFDCVLPE